MTYDEYIESKAISSPECGFDAAGISESCFPFQADIIRWATKKGRCAIFADCGLGKTIMQLEWAKQVHAKTSGNVLILAPLSVSKQTQREGAKFGVNVTICENQDDVKPGINITNYEKLHHFTPDEFAGIVLDESSILKSFDGKTRTQIIESFKETPYRLACTATPAPNDYMELGNHAEFLGVMTRTEMLSMFFVHDGGETQKWRLKGHAEAKFWEFVASWAVVLKKPSDLGYSDNGFALPPMEIKQHVIPSAPIEGTLIPMEAKSLLERGAARRGSLMDRVKVCADLVNASESQHIVWCDLNSESQALTKTISGAVEITGSDSEAHKENAILDFQAGKVRVIVSKPSICGWGLNLQNCASMAFVGLSDSYEAFYQAVRRCWRFGQLNPVTAHVIISEAEGSVADNIRRKESDAEKMAAEMVQHTRRILMDELTETKREKSEYSRKTESGIGWEYHLGDCVDVVSEMKSDSIHYSIFSPPFASLYTYSNSDRDMGNCKGSEDFMAHFQYLIKQLYRVIIPGRLLSFHCMNLPTSKQNHGYIGIQDFRGDLIRAFQAEGFIFHSEVVIWKDPVTAMQRTKALGLLHKQIKKDSCMSRQGIPDYLVTMRKPGENPERVSHTAEEFPVDLWQRYASPVWFDINPSKTLQRQSARSEDDERHICPLQLEVIERAMMMWSNPGDVVLSPFGGIGSEGYQAIKMQRKYIGAELKEIYFEQAVKNLRIAESEGQQDIFAQPTELITA
jgi:DNA modification methylase/superfamily II DNA or RNA helicase